MAESHYRHVKFTDADVVNPEEFIPAGTCNPHHVRPFLLHDHGSALAVVFASNYADALEIAADAGKLDGLKVSKEEVADYPDEVGLTFLGNAGEPYDLEPVDCIELPNPPFSFVALFNAHTN